MVHSARVPGRRWVLLLLLLGAAGACARAVTRTLVSPADVGSLDGESPFLKAHLADGGVYVLSAWRVDSDSSTIVGTGQLYDANREQVDSGAMRVAVDSVALFETNLAKPSGAPTALTVMAGITAAVAGMCAVNPKACFGSCPTIYAPSRDGGLALQAEAFSSSIAPGLEATDIDMLLDAAPAARDYTLRITNEALETHVIRRANVLAAPRPPDGRVYVTSDEVFRQAGRSTAPSRCRSAEGDCRMSVSAADGRERSSVADSTDLASREVIDIEFDQVPPGDLGLVVVSRQTLLTTYLLYQALAYMGRDAGRWLSSAGTASGSRTSTRSLGRVLGSIEVLMPDGREGWTAVGQVGETGPIASDTRVVPLPEVRQPTVRVRLRLTRGLWRLDQVALVPLGDEVVPRRIAPRSVARDGAADSAALRALTEPSRTLVTLPGDVYDVTYRLPPRPGDYDLFLEARGYYLEWMRREWMAEENPLQAARLLLDPEGALRALAPSFKEVEPGIERLFWNSRYAR